MTARAFQQRCLRLWQFCAIDVLAGPGIKAVDVKVRLLAGFFGGAKKEHGVACSSLRHASMLVITYEEGS
jgi:hypothetical protein